MPYQIKLTNGSILLNLPDDSIDDTHTSLQLVGKNYLGYGTAIADNFVQLLENGANSTAPSYPLVGQLWYDTSTHLMKVWSGTAFVPLAIGVSSVVGYTGTVTLAQLVSGGVAPTVSPILTGVPQAPTALLGTDTNQIASTAFVQNTVTALSTGVISVIGNTGIVTLTQLVNGGLAPLSSPGMTGIPTAPTAALGTATTQLATTAFVANSIAANTTGVISVIGNTGVVTLTQLTNGGLAPIASPSFSGVPKAATAAAGTSTNQIATTAFVTSAIAAIPTVATNRIRLAGNPLTLYVSTSGSDTNDGLTLTTAFASLQKAWNTVLYGYDLNGQAVNIKVADGTYTAGALCSGAPPGASLPGNLATGNYGSSYGAISPIVFQSLNGNPTNCIINVTAQACFQASFGAQIDVNGFTLAASVPAQGAATNGSAILSNFDGYVGVSNCIFGDCGNSHLEAYTGLIGLGTSNTISGGATYHYFGTRKGMINALLTTINVTGTPYFSGAFCCMEHNSFIEAGGITFNNAGNVSGQQFIAQYSGIINTGSNDPPSYFPGNVPGNVDGNTFGLLL